MSRSPTDSVASFDLAASAPKGRDRASRNPAAAASPALRITETNPAMLGQTLRGSQGFLKLNMQLDFESHSAERRPFAVVAKSLGPVAIGCVNGTAARFTRTRAHLADGRDLVSLVISDGVDFLLRDARGDGRYGRYGAAVLESRRESSLYSLNDGPAWTICMQRALLEPLLVGPERELQRCLNADNAALRLLVAYVTALFSMEQDIDPQLAATHVGDLAVSALGIGGAAHEAARGRGVYAAKRQVVMDAISHGAANPEFTPMKAAESLGMSLRYLHKLLEPTGRSFSQHLLSARLRRAHEMLRDPGNAALRIAEVAARAGFKDVSHFNRCFRGEYGDTPLGVRVRALRMRQRNFGELNGTAGGSNS